MIASSNSIRPCTPFCIWRARAALAQAHAADARRAQGEDTPLLGVPLAIKDVICVQGHAGHSGQQDFARLRAAL